MVFGSVLDFILGFCARVAAVCADLTVFKVNESGSCSQGDQGRTLAVNVGHSILCATSTLPCAFFYFAPF